MINPEKFNYTIILLVSEAYAPMFETMFGFFQKSPHPNGQYHNTKLHETCRV